MELLDTRTVSVGSGEAPPPSAIEQMWPLISLAVVVGMLGVLVRLVGGEL